MKKITNSLETCEGAIKEYKDFDKVVGELVILVLTLSSSLRLASQSSPLADSAINYLKQNDLLTKHLSNLQVKYEIPRWNTNTWS